MPRTEYAELDDLKAFITMADTTIDRDDLLTIALDAAHDDLEGDCGRRFYLDETATAREYETDGRVVEESAGSVLLVDDIGSTLGLVVESGSGVSFAAVGTYRALPANALVRGRAITGLRLSGGGYWPDATGTDIVRVTARWGWPAVPPSIKQATLLQASRLYARRKSPQGAIGSADWGVMSVRKSDPDYMGLISRFERPGFGG